MKSDYNSLKEQLSRREELAAIIVDSRREFPSLFEDAQRLEREGDRLWEERRRLIDRLDQHGVEHPEQSRDVCALDEQIDANQSATGAARTAVDAMNLRIQEAQEAMAAARGGSLQAVLEHQAELDRAEREVAKLDTLLSEHQQRVDAASGFENPLPALEEQREDLLARIAAGEDKKRELSALEKEIASTSEQVANRQAKAEEVVERSGATLNGLRRRLDGARTERDRLAAMTPKVLSFALRSEIEEAGKEYRSHAEQLLEDFKRLMGLATVLSTIDRGEAGRTGYGQGNSLRLPKFNLDVFADLMGETGRLYFFDAEHNHAYRTEGEQAQRQRLTEQGVRLP
jgi:chromosome segregation ATPase